MTDGQPNDYVGSIITAVFRYPWYDLVEPGGHEAPRLGEDRFGPTGEEGQQRIGAPTGRGHHGPYERVARRFGQGVIHAGFQGSGNIVTVISQHFGNSQEETLRLPVHQSSADPGTITELSVDGGTGNLRALGEIGHAYPVPPSL
ncbi:hypothetical protein AMK32_22455 [Streptomyces sp. CB01883]|nr:MULTISPECIES: hypothetical protein [unclassified Streptomyces]OKJ80571.1 hypothetical protein AMK32_22455 [Streptomyces sp. CB01883]ROP55317.1 hypothetical protein EDD94_4866 [Streptomyces sp. PanSC9]